MNKKIKIGYYCADFLQNNIKSLGILKVTKNLLNELIKSKNVEITLITSDENIELFKEFKCKKEIISSQKPYWFNKLFGFPIEMKDIVKKNRLEVLFFPKVPLPKMVSKPRMFLHQPECTVSFEQLQSLADTHRRRKFNEQVDMVNSDMQLINFASLSVSNLPQKKLTIHFQPIKLEWVSCIFNFPHEVECILPEAMLPGFQFHFLSPKSATRKRAHANLKVYFEEPSIQALPNSQTKELNLMENGDSSQNLKVWVSSPWM